VKNRKSSEGLVKFQFLLWLFRVYKPCDSQPWWYTSVIPTLGKLRKDGNKLEASLGYIVRLSLKKWKK
jgi:hypothetical protein